MRGRIQTALHLIYPPRCVCCGDLVEQDFGLCGTCWSQTPFVTGLVCQTCGLPLPGDEEAGDQNCDTCLELPPPWTAGRAATVYQDHARTLVLRLKHGDRHDIARAAHPWLARAAQPLVRPDMLVVPVPLHWTRLLRRRYNQSALLAQGLARRLKLDYCPDLILRKTATVSSDGLSREARFAELSAVMAPNPRQIDRAKGRSILLVDDVMTSGATLGAVTQACLEAGALRVYVIVLARVAKAM